MQIKKYFHVICAFYMICGTILFTKSTSFADDGICKDQVQPIKIGVILPLSKEDSIYGIPNLFGIITALSSHDLVLRGGCKFQLIVHDDEGDKEMAAAAASELKKDSDVLAILGSASSESTKAILAQTDGKIVVISGQASDTGLKSPWFFRADVPNDQFALSIIDYLSQKDLLRKEITILYKENNPFSKDLENQFKKAFNSPILDPTKTKAYSDETSIKKAVDWIPAKTEVLLVVNGTDKEAAVIIDTLNKKKRKTLKKLEDRIYVIEVHPAIFDTKLFDNVRMFTTYYPASDTTRIGTAKFKRNYEKVYGDFIKPCFLEGSCSTSPLDITTKLSLPKGKFFEEFKKNICSIGMNICKEAREDHLSNKVPSYAVVLGYDQANILLQAIEDQIRSKGDINSLLNDPARRKQIRDSANSLFYPGALGTYVFNEQSRDGIAQPEVITRSPKPLLDSKIPQSDHFKLSFTINYDRKSDDVHTTSLGYSPKISLPYKLSDIITYEPNAFYKYSLEKQDDQRTLVRTWGANILAISYQGLRDYVEPYGSIGLGKAHTESTNMPSQRDFTVIYTAGINIPLSKFTKMFSLNFEWMHYEKYRKTSGLSEITELSAGLKINFPPPK